MVRQETPSHHYYRMRVVRLSFSIRDRKIVVEKIENGFDMASFKTEVRFQSRWEYVVLSKVN